ncbi:anaerobic selenocysteine-containing dehydrogenase [Azospirillum agricola]|uniref:molybdopterin oxidoreductase family protein n=1 Tax=Azospirillum agricola TaxID=1720247 RepID=UPI001AE76216|nr:molybdopterin oxidoreductase family protein [Azospirillum agricola]MBP2229129.1 anaerobic selenocysteine-containing dehydrogenase [Azospirillum agricola]
MPAQYLPTACPHDCPSTCALEVEQLAPDRIGKVRGAADNSYTAGVICAKVSRYAERVHSPDRLKTPLLRNGPKGSGQWKAIGWDEALDRIADSFLTAERTLGAEAVWPLFYAGTMGLVQRGAIQRLRHAKGYSRQISTVCDTPANMGWLAGYGDIRGADPREMAESDLIVNWGGNPVATQVNVMTHVSRARKTRGAKLVTIDPYRTGTAEVSDQHLMLRPGTDGALACAVMHVLFREGFADRAYLARLTAEPERFEAHLASRTPEWASAITGLGVAEIEGFARLYGSTPRSYLRVGYGVSRTHNGAAQMHAVSCLPIVTGSWQHRGGGGLYCSSGIYNLDRTLSEGLDRVDTRIRAFDQSRTGAVLTGDPRDLTSGPPVTAMLIQNTNPAAICPDSNRVRQGFLREDLFVAVHEQFMTDTARLADLVIPATTFLEHDDIYRGGGQMHIVIGRKVIEPQHEARENHWVISEIAKRVGAEHPGFGMSALEIIDAMLKSSGLGDAATLTGNRWIDAQPDFETSHFLNGFAFPDGRFRFAPDWAALGPYGGMPELPDHMPPGREADDEHPFRLVTAPARQFLNTSFGETVTSQRREGRPTALIHPEDAAGLNLAEGAPVRLGNLQGSVVVHAKPFAGVPRGVVIVEGIWPNTAFVEGIGINSLTSPEPIPPAGGAAFHDTAVWLRAA